jgi:hypothetical protein
MSLYAHIKRCLELADRDIASAVADRRMAKALLEQLALVSRPGDGAPKLLLLFARLASAEVEWIEGALRIEMLGDADVTVVEVLSELGLGMRERVFPSFKMNVPLEELVRAVERVPHMVAPLTVAATTGRRLVLTAGEQEAEGEAAPASAVPIGDDSLYGSKRAPSHARSSAKVRASKRAALPTAPAQPGRSVVAKVPLTKMQVSRSSAAAATEEKGPRRPSQHPKRPSIKPLPTRPSRPPELRSKTPPARSVTPKPSRPEPSVARSDPPDELGLDTGWEDTTKE